MIEPYGKFAVLFEDRTFPATDIAMSDDGHLRRFVLHCENGYIISVKQEPIMSSVHYGVFEGWRQDGYDGDPKPHKALRAWWTLDEGAIFERYDDRMMDSYSSLEHMREQHRSEREAQAQ